MEFLIEIIKEFVGMMIFCAFLILILSWLAPDEWMLETIIRKFTRWWKGKEL